MNFKVDNLNVDFSYESEEFLGGSTLQIPSYLLKGFMEHHGIEFDEDTSTIEGLEYGVEELEYWFEDKLYFFSSTNADLHILLYEYMIEESGEESIDIEYWGSNPFWLVHDICHSRKDISGGTIYVDGDIEEQRIYDGMLLAKEVGILHCVGYELLNNCSEGLKERFGNELDMDKALSILNS